MLAAAPAARASARASARAPRELIVKTNVNVRWRPTRPSRCRSVAWTRRVKVHHK